MMIDDINIPDEFAQEARGDAPILAYDPVTRVVTIDGFRFDRALFSAITASPPGIWFRVVERKDGVITLAQDRDPPGDKPITEPFCAPFVKDGGAE